MPDTARTAYLFQCKNEDLYAVSHDHRGQHSPLAVHARLAILREISTRARQAGASADYG